MAGATGVTIGPFLAHILPYFKPCFHQCSRQELADHRYILQYRAIFREWTKRMRKAKGPSLHPHLLKQVPRFMLIVGVGKSSSSVLGSEHGYSCLSPSLNTLHCRLHESASAHAACTVRIYSLVEVPYQDMKLSPTPQIDGAGRQQIRT
ncbi:hypothetical protein JMJ77_0001916 [Colletotrichum scovillei]|uniref:Uncharacterized protein n=1 Tax=Colletotrichum scovillei TaxID=1209932 RepID=A0A9P7UDP6_9PEZI|nr:hypothetical protein JMJ77_0001916 [Colletotrichum scovillei]KAG7070327.1 hypothetical protein JMJ76_0001582 [Colletotrichum scovillei]KAG7078578.1 hypothetical protein JMJ78_0002248 [Colletotrichum scovillei]